MSRDTDTLPQGAEKELAVRRMFDAIAPRYDMVNRIMTFGLDVRWRRHAVRSLSLPAGASVVDAACGTGDLCHELATAGLRPVGVDFARGMLAAARTNAPLVQGDALRLPLPDGACAGATCGFALRNFSDLPGFLAELARVVRPHGRIALLEVAEPERRVLRWGHALYFGRVVPLIGGLLSNRSAYRYLPRSVAYLPPTAELLQLVSDAGFEGVERRLFGLGAAQLITARRAA
jgi:demethylmenaquinone methyltransferase / 2-methoxy-6-polyprenyl-1,4-benzoquinol methylase